MSASIREKQTVALKRMLNFNAPLTKASHAEPNWKVLIYDKWGQDIISPLLSVKELRDMGVTLHLLLDSDREPIQDVPAVYFILPTESNIHRVYTRKILMPALSPTMQEGQILKWMKKEGDAVSPGDILCEIQTDKAVNSMDTDEEGILAKILKPEDSGSVPVGQLIGLLVEEGDDWQNVTIPDDAEVTGDITDDVTTEQPSSQHGSDELRLGPAVKRILDQFNLDPSKVKGTGPHGMIVKGDVLAYVEANGLKAVSPKPVPSPEVATQTAKPETKPEVRPEQAALAKPPAPPAAPAATPVKEQVIEVTPLSEREGQMYTDIPLSNMRKVIAKRLTESKTTIPHSYGTIDCKMDQLLKLRKDLIGDGVKVSVNDFIIKAAGTALQQVPEMNAIWTGEGAQELSDVDISVAVATDNGLITPIVKDVPGLGLKDITAKVRDLSVRAREGKLKLDEFQGGSFTISNLGMFGITEFSAVINPPQACILAIGTSRVELDADLQTQTLMAVTLSADARIVSESSKAKFLEAFRDVIENPMLMITQPTPLKREALFAK